MKTVFLLFISTCISSVFLKKIVQNFVSNNLSAYAVDVYKKMNVPVYERE